MEYAYPKDIQNKQMDTFNSISNQITSEEGVEYNVMIGFVSNFLIPKYIQNFGQLSLVLLCGFIISVIAWIFTQVDVRINYRWQ